MLENECAECGVKASDGYALYCVKCSEPMREWVGLTNEEIIDLWESDDVPQDYGLFDFSAVVRIITTKLKEKNSERRQH